MNNLNKTLGLFVVVALALAIVPTTSAQTTQAAFGTVVDSDDGDTTYTLLAGSPALFCFVDDDASGTFNSDESVYLAVACTTVAGNDVRIANSGSNAKGSQVRSSNADFGNPLTALPGAGGWYDADGDTFFTAGETWYHDTDASGTVTVNDIVLSGSNAGNVVTASTSGLNNPLTALAIASTFFDADGSTAYDSGDVVYHDSDGSGDASVQDVRLGGASVPVQTGGGSSGTGTSTGTGTGTSTGTGTETSTGTSTPTSNTQTSSNVNTATGGSDDEETDENKTPGFELVALVAALGAALVLVRRKL